MTSQNFFGTVDYVVFGVTIIISIAIGMYVALTSKKKSTNIEYLVGDRKMKLVPVALSLLVTYLSPIGILGNPAEVYGYGTQFMLYIVALILGVFAGTFIFVPLYYPLNITSVYEYLRLRFGAKYVEYLSVFLGIVTGILFNGVIIYSPCLAFEAVSGFPTWASILISGVTTIVYTTMGGMKAVVWTDVFQAGVIFVGLISLVAKATIDVGGISEVWSLNKQWGRLKFFDFSFDPTMRQTFWSVVVMNTFLWICIVTDQPSVQRFMALSSIKKAKLSTLFIAPGLMTSGLLTCSCGVTAFAYYARIGCDPVTSGQISGPNEIIPRLVVDVLDIPGLPGIFIACMFCASISSVSSGYSAMGAMMWQDVLRERFGHLPDSRQTTITKITTAVVGALCIATSFIFISTGGTIIQITYSVLGGIGGPMMGTFIVGGLFPRAGPKGVLVGVLCSLSFCMWLSVGSTLNGGYTPPIPGPIYNCTQADIPANQSSVTTTSIYNVTSEPEKEVRSGVMWMYSISYFYYPVFGIGIVMIIAPLCSLIPNFDVIPPTPKRLLFPCIRRHFGVPDEPTSLDQKVEMQLLDVESKERMTKDNGDLNVDSIPFLSSNKDNNSPRDVYSPDRIE